MYQSVRLSCLLYLDSSLPGGTNSSFISLESQTLSRVRKSESPSGVGIRLPSQWAQALVTRVPHSVSFEYGRCQRESALMWIHDKGEHATLQVIRWCGSRDLKFLSITGVISCLGECHTICHRCSCTWHECAAFDT